MKLFVVIAMLLMGCVKQHRNSDLKRPATSLSTPMIKITSPRDYQRFRAGQTVSISATITDDKQLQRVHLLVIRASGAQVLRSEKNLGVKSYNLSESFTVTEGPQSIIKIEAVDQNNNNTETRIEVSCK